MKNTPTTFSKFTGRRVIGNHWMQKAVAAGRIPGTEIYGHQTQVDVFLQACEAEKLHHAWLLTGPQGIGKSAIAHHFSQFLLNDQDALLGYPSTILEVPCLPPVVLIDSSPDFMRVRRLEDEKTKRLKSHITVDQIRAVNRFLSLTSALGGWRVVLIDAADDMNTNAANALLKTLEEPPEKTVLFLVSHNPGRLLPTIRSRCRSMAFQPLEKTEMQQVLAPYALETPPEDIELALKLAKGRPGYMLKLLSEGGVGLYRQLIHLYQQFPAIDAGDLLTFADFLSKNGNHTAWDFYEQLNQDFLQRLITSQATGQKMASYIEIETKIAQQLGTKHTLESLMILWEKTCDLFRNIHRLNLDKKQVVLSQFMTLSS